jgi:hypothetical protein
VAFLPSRAGCQSNSALGLSGARWAQHITAMPDKLSLVTASLEGNSWNRPTAVLEFVGRSGGGGALATTWTGALPCLQRSMLAEKVCFVCHLGDICLRREPLRVDRGVADPTPHLLRGWNSQSCLRWFRREPAPRLLGHWDACTSEPGSPVGESVLRSHSHADQHAAAGLNGISTRHCKCRCG